MLRMRDAFGVSSHPQGMGGGEGSRRFYASLCLPEVPATVARLCRLLCSPAVALSTLLAACSLQIPLDFLLGKVLLIPTTYQALAVYQPLHAVLYDQQVRWQVLGWPRREGKPRRREFADFHGVNSASSGKSPFRTRGFAPTGLHIPNDVSRMCLSACTCAIPSRKSQVKTAGITNHTLWFRRPTHIWGHGFGTLTTLLPALPPPPGLPLLLPSWLVCFLLFSVPFLPLPPSWLATPHPALFSSSSKQGGHANARTNSRAKFRSSSRRPSPRDVLLALFIQGTRTNCRVY